jgi:glycerophosphoryl diester phosphodiesterase
MRRLILILLLVPLGCGYFAAPERPLIAAHRAAAGNWPENSRTAVQGSIAARYPVLEFDVVLTRDLVPVIWHDYWIGQELCTRSDGSPIQEEILLQELTLDELHGGFLCGGVPDPDHPNVEWTPHRLLTLEELLRIAATAPEVMLHVDLKHEPGKTPSAEVFAEKLLPLLKAGPNPFFITASLPEQVRAFKAADPNVPVHILWPRFPKGASTTAIGLENELLATLGVRDPIGLARSLGADGIGIPWQLVDRRVLEAARDEGLKVLVWTVNEARLLEQYCRWPIDILITDYPERAPCLSSVP